MRRTEAARKLRVTPEHTTAEAIEMMTDHDDDTVVIVDRDTKEMIGSMSRTTLVDRCVRAWHEPARCRLANHVNRTGLSS